MKVDHRLQESSSPNMGIGWENAEVPPSEDFHYVFDRYFRPVLHFFLNRGISYEDSRDLTQETFLRVYKGFERFRGDSSIQTWIFQIAANLWCNHLRNRRTGKRHGKEVSLEGAIERGIPVSSDLSQTLGPEFSGPLESILEAEQAELLHQALRGLPPQMHRCVLLRIGQGLKYREIAQLMQISIDTVKSQISQAKERLKRDLGSRFDVSRFGGEGG
jgi:RNA polymerase sigma-70 factor, ECF subfamily